MDAQGQLPFDLKKEFIKHRQGLIVAHRQGVDMSTLKSSDIKSKVEEVGKVKEIDSPEEIE